MAEKGKGIFKGNYIFLIFCLKEFLPNTRQCVLFYKDFVCSLRGGADKYIMQSGRFHLEADIMATCVALS